MTKRDDEAYCRKFCTGRLGWNAAERQKCREETACMPFRDRDTERDKDARIAELEKDRDHWRNLVNDLECNGIYLDSIAFYEGRHKETVDHITALKSAILCACDFLDALQKDTGVGGGTAFMLRAVLNQEVQGA